MTRESIDARNNRKLLYLWQVDFFSVGVNTHPHYNAAVYVITWDASSAAEMAVNRLRKLYADESAGVLTTHVVKEEYVKKVTRLCNSDFIAVLGFTIDLEGAVKLASEQYIE
jgi:hypothetical protein